MKKREILKVSLVSVSAIAIFSVLFVGAQTFIMRSSQQEEEMLPPYAIIMPNDFKMPDVDIHNEGGVVNGVALSGEEAVKVAMMYIMEIFAEEYDTGSVEVIHESLGPWWEIYVKDHEEELL